MKSIVVIVWALVICAGMGWLWEYSLRPGGKGQALPTWPVQASIAPIPGRYNLVLSLHPHCPCSSATAVSSSNSA